MTALSSILAAVSVAVLWPRAPAAVTRVRGLAPTFPPPAGGPPPPARRSGRPWRSAAATGLVRRGRALAAARADVIALCDAMGAELRAGRSPTDALRAAVPPGPRSPGPTALPGTTAGPPSPLGRLATLPVTAVPGVLDEMSARPGYGGLRHLAVCWRVAHESGGALADSIERVADRHRADERVRRDVAVLLAGPRSTARLLAALPGAGVLLGGALGADPLGVLLGLPVGRVCLVAGLALTVTGWWWTAKITAAAVPT